MLICNLKILIILDPIECINDWSCPDFLACGDDQYCVDPPCPNCAVNAQQKYSNHTCLCSCPPFSVGDPYIEGCQRQGEMNFSPSK